MGKHFYEDRTRGWKLSVNHSRMGFLLWSEKEGNKKDGWVWGPPGYVGFDIFVLFWSIYSVWPFPIWLSGLVGLLFYSCILNSTTN